MADAQIEVAPLALPRAFVGRSVMTSEKDMFSDAPVLARRLAEVKEDVPCRVMPVVTAVICDEPGEEPVRRALAAAEGLEAVRYRRASSRSWCRSPWARRPPCRCA